MRMMEGQLHLPGAIRSGGYRLLNRLCSQNSGSAESSEHEYLLKIKKQLKVKSYRKLS
jgi:hypothetical protein